MARGLRSAKVKLIRAAKHLQAIKKCIATYARTKPHKIVKKTKGKKKLNVPKSPSLEISLLAGEMVYQMRSALDHLVFDLIKRNPNVATIDSDWEENCQFPMRVRCPRTPRPRLTKKRSSVIFRGLPMRRLHSLRVCNRTTALEQPTMPCDFSDISRTSTSTDI